MRRRGSSERGKGNALFVRHFFQPSKQFFNKNIYREESELLYDCKRPFATSQLSLLAVAHEQIPLFTLQDSNNFETRRKSPYTKMPLSGFYGVQFSNNAEPKRVKDQ